MLQGKILRVARPTDRLAQVVHFYTKGLGLQIIDYFENHAGFDGVMVGIPGESYHFDIYPSTRAYGWFGANTR